MRTQSSSWLDEIDLDPQASWLRMGTRQLGRRPWLVVDDERDRDLALKQELCRTRHDEVFAAEPGSEGSGSEVLELVRDELTLLGLPFDDSGAEGRHALDRHPLDRCGRQVQEDLCLMRRDRSGWVLAAASLCFPSRWRLQDKLGLSVTDVHQPVPGYRSELAGRVDSLFDRLGPQIVWRRNWFIHPDPSLFQPDRPVDGDPVIPAGRCRSELSVRSERQTLRRLPETGWILFTIRTQQASLGRFVEDRDRLVRFQRFLAEVPADAAAHRGLSAPQMAALRTELGSGVSRPVNGG